MSKQLEYIFFEFATEQTLQNRSNLLRLLNTILQVKVFDVVAANLDEESVHDVGKVVDQAWKKCEEQGQSSLSFFFRNDSLFLTIAIDRRRFRRLAVSVDSSYISDLQDQHYRNVRALVQVCELVYETLHPEYGYGLVTPNVHPLMEFTENRTEIQVVFDYNFLGPRLVQILGSTKVLSVPTWRTLEFDDGGVFLEMSPNPIAEWVPYTDNYEKAVEILGAQKYLQGG